MNGAPDVPGSAGPSIVVVIPAYRAERTIGAVLRAIPAVVRHVVVVEDGSTDDTAGAARAVADPRITVVRHRRNEGVGGAMLTGYGVALRLGADVVVKLDADGQMDPGELPHLVAPIARGEVDYAKGNRFLFAFPPVRMPLVRMVGNLGLTFLTKLASGYWNIFDPTNGYTAIHASVLRRLDPDAIARGYFFETSLLIELRRLGAVVRDVALPARYADEPSSMSIPRVLVSFPPRLLVGLVRRLGRQYLLYDFTPGSVLGLLGGPLLLFGVLWSAIQWYLHASEGRLASTGTVLVGVLPIILGTQLLLQALSLDIGSVPAAPLHPRLTRTSPSPDLLLVHLERQDLLAPEPVAPAMAAAAPPAPR
jgi:dolichol-phosphate mannosyltransferase